MKIENSHIRMTATANHLIKVLNLIPSSEPYYNKLINDGDEQFIIGPELPSEQ